MQNGHQKKNPTAMQQLLFRTIDLEGQTLSSLDLGQCVYRSATSGASGNPDFQGSVILSVLGTNKQ